MILFLPILKKLSFPNPNPNCLSKELNSWNFERMFTPHQVSHVICHMSHAMCLLSHFYLFLLTKLFCLYMKGQLSRGLPRLVSSSKWLNKIWLFKYWKHHMEQIKKFLLWRFQIFILNIFKSVLKNKNKWFTISLIFQKSILFSEMKFFGITNFELDLSICIANAIFGILVYAHV